VVHFEIYGENPNKLMDFYSRVFNWTFEKWGERDYWIIKTGKGLGIDGGLGTGKGSSNNTIDVPDVDAYLKKIQQARGTLVLPKTTMPGVRYLAYFKEPQGNIFGIMKNNPNAI
jgi:hypothetical protein